MATTIDLKISPIPAQVAGRPCVFDGSALLGALRAALALNIVAPTSRVVVSQSGGFVGRDVNQFQVHFGDARSWVEVVEFLGGDYSRPSLTRVDGGFQFSFAEWTAVVALRAAMLDAHRALGQPDLVQLTMGDGSAATVLNAQPGEVARSQGDIVVGWHAPLAGHFDWVALYLVGAPNSSFVAYQYVPDGQVDGEFLFAVPATPGSYEFRYLVANSYVDVARSMPVVVS